MPNVKCGDATPYAPLMLPYAPVHCRGLVCSIFFFFCTGISSFSLTNLVGTYVSPAECSGFSSTIVSIDSSSYSAWFSSDVLPPGVSRRIDGQYVQEENRIYLVVACILSEWIIKKPREPSLRLNVERWNLTNINQTIVLMKDDALKLWRKEQHQIGCDILIKVSDFPRRSNETITYPSLNVLTQGLGSVGSLDFTNQPPLLNAAGSGLEISEKPE